MWLPREARVLALLFSLLAVPAAVEAESPACAEARAIVAEIEKMSAEGRIKPGDLLARAKTAADLCPSLGSAWKQAYCGALAAGDKRVKFYQDRATFSGVSDLECGGAGEPRVPARPPGYVREKFALVIGISKFKDPAIRSLRFAAKDARDLAAVLTDPRHGRFNPANVFLLTDENATRANILDAIQTIFDRAREEDLVFLYFSSHGSPSQDDLGLQGVGYIATYDSAARRLYVDALEYEYLSKKMSLIKARRKIAFFDTCYSGQAKPGGKGLVIDSRGVDDRTARLFLSGEGTYVVTSSRASERSYESDKVENSYFTHFLIEALKAGPEPPTVRQVFDLLSRRVPEAVLREKGEPQHPQIFPADGPGDVLIGVQPQAPIDSRPPANR
jgi:hypothetical protein